MKVVDVKKALSLLKLGQVVCIPTETVYGLAAPINSKASLKKIFEIKNRPLFDPLIVHISNFKMLNPLIRNPHPILIHLAHRFWPGPLTLVFERNPLYISDIITASQNTVAIRWPKHDLTENIIQSLGVGLAAPSANPFKKTSPTKASHVSTYFPDLPILDGGPCSVGIESTVVRLKNKTLEILRPGIITKSQIEQALEGESSFKDFCVIEAPNTYGPGSMKAHYQPSKPFYLLIDQISKTKIQGTKMLPIHLPKNPLIAARQIYGKLLDIPEEYTGAYLKWNSSEKTHEHWTCILNRLEKAATKIVKGNYENNKDSLFFKNL